LFPPRVIDAAYEALNAYEALVTVPTTLEAVTNEAVVAVPCNDPVMPPVTIRDPVICELPSERNPFFILNSFAISVHFPRLG
jgi:hypothetical protein